MNETARSRPRLPLLILAGLVPGLVLEGASKLALAAQRDPANEKKVMVTLKLDAAGHPVAINTPDPDPVHLSRSGKHVAHWVLDTPIDAAIEIVMADGTKPFKKHPTSTGKHAVSDPPDLGVGDYKYSIIVRLKDGTRLPVLDPGIKVDP